MRDGPSEDRRCRHGTKRVVIRPWRLTRSSSSEEGSRPGGSSPSTARRRRGRGHDPLCRARPPYNRPPLTKGFLRTEQDRDSTLVRPLAEYEDDVVELRLGTTVDGDPPRGRTRSSSRAASASRTAKLVLATGARPRVLPIPGADLVGVHTYRTLADAEAVSAAAEEARSAIVIGASFIGAETAASLRSRGLDVTLVEMGDTLMPQLRCADLSAELVDLYRAEGVDVLLETQVEELTGNGRLLTGARTKDGETIEGYLAIVGVGVVPNVELAEEAGADVDDGIVVDERFRTSLRDVYAIGDVARYPDPTDRAAPPDRALVERRRPGRAPRPPAGGLSGELRRAPRLLHAAVRGASCRCSATSSRRRSASSAGRSPRAALIGFHLADDGRLVGAVIHGQAADVAVELEELLRGASVVDDPVRLLDGNLRPADAVVA